MALVEDADFSRLMLDREPGPPWDSVDLDADPDWEWHSAAEDTPEQLDALWQDAVARSRSSRRRHSPRAAWITSAGTPRPAVSHPTCGASSSI